MSKLMYNVNRIPLLTTIHLSNERQTYTVERALERMAAKERRGAQPTPYSEEKMDLWKEICDYGAEVAFCKLFDCQPDEDDTTLKVWDAMLPDGRTVDVKRNPIAKDLLVKRTSHLETPVLYASIMGVFPHYTFNGIMKSIEVRQPENWNTTQMRLAPGWFVHQEVLHKHTALVYNESNRQLA